MMSINKQWNDMQLAFRKGYVVTFRELACAPGYYSLDPEIMHPEFIHNAIPGKHKKEEVQKLLGFMKVEYKLLTLQSVGQDINIRERSRADPKITTT